MHDIDPNVIIWLVIAIINIAPATIAALFSIKAHRLALKIEVATNSMKDALVTASKEASLAEGREIGRAEGVVRAQALLEENEPHKNG